ncbi:hypothetical protein A9Q81_02310 [Gammaproteobacteria bacterium 42_54_T18]|nr:hypothetical protein A9Q81_02310 [Gammaproteobacteria bacterium 42_54_T18]
MFQNLVIAVKVREGNGALCGEYASNQKLRDYTRKKTAFLVTICTANIQSQLNSGILPPPAPRASLLALSKQLQTDFLFDRYFVSDTLRTP